MSNHVNIFFFLVTKLRNTKETKMEVIREKRKKKKKLSPREISSHGVVPD